MCSRTLRLRSHTEDNDRRRKISQWITSQGITHLRTFQQLRENVLKSIGPPRTNKPLNYPTAICEKKSITPLIDDNITYFHLHRCTEALGEDFVRRLPPLQTQWWVVGMKAVYPASPILCVPTTSGTLWTVVLCGRE